MHSSESAVRKDVIELDVISCRPFLKWAGGKKSLLPQLLKAMPESFGSYFEPMIGGGALFFQLQPSPASISDINEELINLYEVVRDEVDELLEDLRQHPHSKDYFYELRNADREESYGAWSKIKRASRLIYLNKTCFNGLYRVNSRGEFNVPFGDYSNPTIADEANLRACNKALQGVEIHCKPVEVVEEAAQAGDFVYFDPPYAPLSPTANFTSYSLHGFTSKDHQELRNLCVRLDQKGVQFMLTNSCTDLVLDLYKEFRLHLIQAPRAINSKGDKRGKVNDLIVTNY